MKQRIHKYCINLDRRPDRWNKVQEEFKKNKINNVERFEATDGKYLPKSRSLTVGEVGLIHSYIRVLQDAINKEYDIIFIFEDDVIFVDKFNKLFGEYIRQLPQDWDYINMGALLFSPSINRISKNIYKADHCTLAAHAIILKKSIFTILIEELSKYQGRLDSVVAEVVVNHKAYGFFPAIALQENGFSDTRNKIINGKTMILKEEERLKKINHLISKNTLNNNIKHCGVPLCTCSGKCYW